MQFAIQKSRLQAELSIMQTIVERKNAIPILDTVRIESNGGHAIKLTTTNMETTIYAETLTDNVGEEGAMCIPARRLFEIVRLMPDAIMQFTQDTNDWVRLVAEGTKYRVPCAHPENYPAVPNPAADDLTWLSVPSKYLQSIIEGVAYSIAPEEHVQYMLKGAKLEIDGTDVKMFSTDSHRFSAASGPLTALLMEDLDVLIPERGLTELARIISEYDGDLHIAKGGNYLFFKAGKRVLATRLLSGHFPNVQLVFDVVKDYEHFMTAKTDVLAKSIKRAMLVADVGSSAVSLQFKDGNLYLRAENADAGEVEEILPTNFNGGDLGMHVNAKFLMEFLDAVGSGMCRVEIKDAVSPLHLTAEKDNVKYSYICMPCDVPT